MPVRSAVYFIMLELLLPRPIFSNGVLLKGGWSHYRGGWCVFRAKNAWNLTNTYVKLVFDHTHGTGCFWLQNCKTDNVSFKLNELRIKSAIFQFFVKATFAIISRIFKAHWLTIDFSCSFFASLSNEEDSAVFVGCAGWKLRIWNTHIESRFFAENISYRKSENISYCI